ncbi:hypothetical protein OCUBac02_15490 [Bosea sp. ANAM02]|nr:hypothetical protein OCUBac02_15490 [Bosea sp. ANAM02]
MQAILLRPVVAEAYPEAVSGICEAITLARSCTRKAEALKVELVHGLDNVGDPQEDGAVAGGEDHTSGGSGIVRGGCPSSH